MRQISDNLNDSVKVLIIVERVKANGFGIAPANVEIGGAALLALSR
jgi:hypothetical protein